MFHPPIHIAQRNSGSVCKCLLSDRRCNREYFNSIHLQYTLPMLFSSVWLQCFPRSIAFNPQRNMLAQHMPLRRAITAITAHHTSWLPPANLLEVKPAHHVVSFIDFRITISQIRYHIRIRYQAHRPFKMFYSNVWILADSPFNLLCC